VNAGLMQIKTGDIRYNSFDALRACMMILGLVLHTVLSYTTYTEGFFANFFKDSFTSRVCDGLLWWIHIFRMPVFFVMAGFFALLVFKKKGRKLFIKNRLNRIVYPLLVAWIILNPFIRIAFTFPEYISDLGLTGALKQAFNKILLSPWGLGPLHLWFLYFLALFYMLMLIVFKLPDPIKNIINKVFCEVMKLRLRVLFFALITIVLLLFMEAGTFDTPRRFIPINPGVFFSYFYFFSFGILLYKNRDLVESLKKDIWILPILSFAAFAVHFYFVDIAQYPKNINTFNIVMASVSGGICCWLCIFSVTGVFLKYLENGNKLFRATSDASYWVFLIHFPIVLLLIGIAAPLQIPALLKCLIIILSAYFLLMGSYKLFVKNTFIGKFLNGKPMAETGGGTEAAAGFYPENKIQD
jgi:glucan biosynthesis protein C